MGDARGLEREPRASLALWDYRRQVSDMYALVRTSTDPSPAWTAWKESRDDLFRSHSQSALPLEQRSSFTGLDYFPYDPAARVVATIESVPDQTLGVAHSGEGSTPARAFGTARFTLGGAEHALTLFWLEEYGGGVFLPFRDATNGSLTYGGGRYLLDTTKGADLGWDEGGVVLDFNFAYHPSCVYDSIWSCPLAPPDQRLAIPVGAGERL